MTRIAAALVFLLTGAAVVAGFAAGRGPQPADVGSGLAVGAVWAVAGWRAWTAPAAPDPVLPGAALLAAAALAASRFPPTGARVATGLALAALAAAGHWLLALPGGGLRSAGRKVAALVVYATAAAAAAALIAEGDPLTRGAAGLSVAAGFLLALPWVRHRYVHGRAAERDRLRWLGAGLLGGGAVVVVTVALHLILDWPSGFYPALVSAAALPAASVFLSRAKVLHGAGGRALVDALSVTGFVVAISAVYLVVVRGLGQVPPGTAGRESVGLSMIAAGVTAVSFGPARRWLLDRANRLVLGDRPRPDDLVSAFGSRLTRSVPMDELLLQMAESLVRALDLVRADVYTGTGDVMERVAGFPDAAAVPRIPVTGRERPAVVRAGVSGNAWIQVWIPSLLRGPVDENQMRVAPIRNAGELLGLLVVERSASAEPFTEDDDRILGDLAREVGLALHNTQLDAALRVTLADLRVHAAELRRSRARIVASGDAVRRRVERDLHDGAQQSLVAVAIGLRLARDTIERDPEAAAQMLEEMNGEVQRAIAELRELAHGIYPPLLAEEGLAAALSLAGSRSQLVVSVDVQCPDRFDQEVEAAVYFCCLEALQNAAKHAAGATVAVRVWQEGANLYFRIVDDGPGFDAGSTPTGHGLVNMADRVGAIGGRVDWRSQPGRGVEVAGSVPIIVAEART